MVYFAVDTRLIFSLPAIFPSKIADLNLMFSTCSKILNAVSEISSPNSVIYNFLPTISNRGKLNCA